jgi:ribosomal protein L35
MKKSVTKRIKTTKSGKLLRRKMGIGHNGSRTERRKQLRKKHISKSHPSDRKSLVVAANRVN